MKISGLIKSSLIDYPGKITAIVFTQGCNFRCPFCHNPDLESTELPARISEDFLFNFLEKRKDLLDAVTITGGEPTIHEDLAEFIAKIKELGYFVKLDSNGTNPAFLKQILDGGNVDYVAMDIKQCREKYPLVAGKVDVAKIARSIEIIKTSGLKYEFRTTVLPKLHHLEDFERMGQMIMGSNNYFIQNFMPEVTLNKTYQKERSFTLSELQEIKKIMQKYVKNCSIRENI